MDLRFFLLFYSFLFSHSKNNHKYDFGSVENVSGFFGFCIRFRRIVGDLPDIRSKKIKEDKKKQEVKEDRIL